MPEEHSDLLIDWGGGNHLIFQLQMVQPQV